MLKCSKLFFFCLISTLMLSVQDSKNALLTSKDFQRTDIALPSIAISFEGVFTDPNGISYWMIATRRGNSAGGIGNQIILTRLSDKKSAVFEAGDGVIKEPIYVPSTNCLYGVNSDPADLWKIDLTTFTFQTILKSERGLADKMMKSLILGTDGLVHVGGMNKGALASFNPKSEQLFRWGIIDRPEGDSTKFYRMVYYLAETPDAFGISIRDINIPSWYFVWKDKKSGKETTYFKGESNEKVGVQTLKSKDGKRFAFKVNCSRKPGLKESFIFENNSMKPFDAETKKEWTELNQETAWKSVDDFNKSSGTQLFSSNIDAKNQPYLVISQQNTKDTIFIKPLNIDLNRPFVFGTFKDENYWSSGKYQPLFKEKNGIISLVAKLPMISAYTILPDSKGEYIYVAGYPSIWVRVNTKSQQIDTILNGSKHTKYFTRQILLGGLIISAGNHERDTVGSEIYYYNPQNKRSGKFMNPKLEGFLANKSILNLTAGKNCFYVIYKSFGDPNIQLLEVRVKKNEVIDFQPKKLPFASKALYINQSGNWVSISDTGIHINNTKAISFLPVKIEGAFPTFPKHHLNAFSWIDSNTLIFWTSNISSKKSMLYGISLKTKKVRLLYETNSAYNVPSMEQTKELIYFIRQMDPLLPDQSAVNVVSKKRILNAFGK